MIKENKQIRNDIINEAKKYLNTPFLHQGRNKNGLDCLGLILIVLKNLNLYDKEHKDYSFDVDGNSFYSKLKSNLREIPYNELKNGDIILFNIAGNPQHVGFYYKENNREMIIHSYNSIGKVVTHELSFKWKRRIYSCFTIFE